MYVLERLLSDIVKVEGLKGMWVFRKLKRFQDMTLKLTLLMIQS